VFAFGALFKAPAQNAPNQNASAQNTLQTHLRKPSNHSGLPVRGEFEAKETETPQAKEIRQTREARYGKHLPEPLVDPGPTVDGGGETSHLRFIDYVRLDNSPDPPGIPASVSTAIVVGTVVSGRCFINETHTFVYTDYKVKVDDILKPDPSTSLTIGDLLTASRPGGAVHFPSGHVTNVLNVGQGLPEIGAQYVLFLWKTIPNLPEYEILIDSGYQLKNDRTYALDDATSQYNGEEVNALLEKIHKAISASQTRGKP